MRKNISLILGFVLMITGASVFAEESKIETSASASVGYFSDYMWRGIKIGEKSAVQPSVEITYGSFTTNFWSSYDNATKELIETDITLSYSKSFDKLGLNAGYIYYSLDGASDTEEVYIGLSYDVLLSPELKLYYDYLEGDGTFLTANLGHSINVTKDISLDLGLSASYNGSNKIMGTGEDGKEFSGLYNGEISLGTSIPLAENLSIDPFVAYTLSLSDDAKTALEGLSGDQESTNAYGGISISLSF